MGRNDHMEESNFDEVDKYVCPQCVKDLILGELVGNNLSSNYCGYCKETSNIPFASSFSFVMQKIYDAILKYYGDAQNLSLPHDEGEWILPEVQPDLIVCEFDPGWESEFLEDVIDCIGYEKYWIKHTNHNWLESGPSHILQYGWNTFTQTVKYKTRYLFSSDSQEKSILAHDDYIPAHQFLYALSDLTKRLNLISAIPQGTAFFRARILSANEKCDSFSEISIPPARTAKAGRMNPAGIPYLYIALDRETARLETLKKDTERQVLGTMELKSSLNVLNLSKLPQTPSIFDIGKFNQRQELLFFNNFKDEISQRINRDGKEHIDYVPTQIISEFYRYEFTYNNKKIDGIMYPSSENNGGSNIAIFLSDHADVEKIIDLILLEDI